MNKKNKAVLISALVMPGIGHLYLKKYILGLLFAAAFLIPVILIGQIIWSMTNEFSQRINNGEIALETIVLLKEFKLFIQSIYSSIPLTHYAFLIIIWVLSALDCYRIGSKKA